ncbi:MAG: polyphosphate kinase 2 family protein [Planctomycetia bacterium]|nr:polyphosphate kinase 2 family protein [Planctomycetia bacterium]
MIHFQDQLSRFRVPTNDKFKLKDFDPAWNGDGKVPEEERKRYAESLLAEGIKDLAEAQNLLYASDTWSLLVIFQAMDAAGKDGTIKHVLSGVNPQGCQVYSFKQPSSEELDHDFLWRCAKALPERGRIGIFNRSYYEEVLVVKVHPEYLHAQRLPESDVSTPKFWKHRYKSINNFERHLARNGTRIIKFFLNVSKEEQKRRFLERIDDPKKHWKFSPTDIAERGHWSEYMDAYDEMLHATTTKWAPWYVIPADHKWVARAAVATILTQEIKQLDLKYPEPSEAVKGALEASRQKLMGED